jgi:hypothetical protein
LPALMFKIIHLFFQHGYNAGGFFASIKNNCGGGLCHVCLRLGAEFLSYGFETNSVRRERHKWVVKRRISRFFVQGICLREWFDCVTTEHVSSGIRSKQSCLLGASHKCDPSSAFEVTGDTQALTATTNTSIPMAKLELSDYPSTGNSPISFAAPSLCADHSHPDY